MKRMAMLVVMGLLAFGSASAYADGGKSITSAPSVVYDQQQFGNTANGEPDGPCNLNSWWRLAVTAGDEVTVDVEHENAFTYVRVFPVGTTDFTFRTEQPVFEKLWPAKQFEINLIAAQSGDMPLLFNANPSCVQSVDPGPYDFTAYVKHGVRLSVPHRAKLRRRATLKVGARTPEGGTISDSSLTVTVQVKAPHRAWKIVGHAPVQDSAARVKLKIPRKYVGRKVKLRARATGANYLSVTSSAARVRVR